MIAETTTKFDGCAHGVRFDQYCFACDYISKALPPTKTRKSQLKFDELKTPNVVIEYRDKGPIPKSHFNGSYIKLRADHEGYMLLITPRGAAFNLDKYAIVPIEEWFELNRPFIRSMVRVLNFFKKVLVFGKIRRR